MASAVQDRWDQLGGHTVTLYLPVGPPGCGKSRLAKGMFGDSGYGRKALLAEDAVVSTDQIRKIMTGNPTDQSVNGEAWTVAKTIAHTRLEHGLTVYFDATNLNPDWYDKLLAKAQQREHRVLFILFDTDYPTCRGRNLARKELAIPDVAVERMIELHRAIRAEDLNGDVITGSDLNHLVAGIHAWIDGLPPPEEDKK
jgi:predicted kinase